MCPSLFDFFSSSDFFSAIEVIGDDSPIEEVGILLQSSFSLAESDIVCLFVDEVGDGGFLEGEGPVISVMFNDINNVGDHLLFGIESIFGKGSIVFVGMPNLDVILIIDGDAVFVDREMAVSSS